LMLKTLDECWCWRQTHSVVTSAGLS